MTVYISDLDGTLLKNDKSLSEYSRNVLNRLIQSGTAFTYATARSFSSARGLVDELCLKIPVITFNGVFVVDPKSGEHIIENNFSKKALKTAEKFIEKNALAPLVYSYIDGAKRVSYLESRLKDVLEYVNSRSGDRRLRPVSDYAELFRGNVFYITLFNAENTKELDAVFCEKNGFSRNIQADNYDDMVWYEIYSKNAGKDKAVLQLKKLLKAQKLVCFGDNFNDLKMLGAADVGVAVENACDELKSSADVVAKSNENDGVARYIEESLAPSDRDARFEKAKAAAFSRAKNAGGPIGTQNEKLIHAALKNYYAPFSDEQEIRLGNYFADAVSENGIFEIQSRGLYRLSDKLSAFLPAARVNVVYPLVCKTKTVFINTQSGEVLCEKISPTRRSLYKAFEEMYSIRRFLKDENLSVIIAALEIEKRVYIRGEEIPDLRSRAARKKCVVEKVPIKILDEIWFTQKSDYKKLIPRGLSQSFTKSEFAKAANEAKSSLRLEILREVGIIKQTGKKKRENLYVLEEQ